jgi:hypothetical protein
MTQPPSVSRIPSGLFPAGRTRPTYREPHPVKGPAVAAGAGAATAWMLVFGLVDTSLRGYAWWTLLAGGIAWVVAGGLTWAGDRGVAAGIAAATGVAWAAAGIAIAVGWATTGNWPMW